MNICENLTVPAALFPERHAILFEGRSLTYRSLEQRSGRAAAVLRAWGITRGDRVGLLLPNVPAFAVWYYACLRLGAIAVSINTRLVGEEVAFILGDCEARILVGTAKLVAVLGEHRPKCVERIVTAGEDGARFDGAILAETPSIGAGVFVDMEPDAPATILYTSGTTGFPKGATLSHRNVRATVHAFNHLCEMVTGDRLLLAVPLFHCFGQNALLNSGLNLGSTLVLQRRFDLDEAVRLIAEHQVTKLFTVPAVFHLLYDRCSPADLASVGYCFTAAAKMPLQLAQRWQTKFGQPIYEGYGLTETAPFASYNHRLRFVPGSIGTPVDLVEMKVVDPETGETCPPRTPGEIVIRGPNVMLGYWNRPEINAKVLRDGWFHSGDIGETDELGYFYIVDRLKDMIAVGGLKIFPAEVERVLLDHPAVAQAAVVGHPDEVLGEKVVAFVTLRPGADVATPALRAYCQPRLANYKVPAQVVVLETLPRNPSGKVLKTELRKIELTRAAPGDDTPNLRAALGALPAEQRRSQLQAFVRSEVASLLGVAESQLSDNRGFVDLGLDSVNALDLRKRLEARLEHPLPSTVSFDFPTIESLTGFLAERAFGTADAEPVPEAGAAPRPAGRPDVAAVDAMTEDDVLGELLGGGNRSDG